MQSGCLALFSVLGFYDYAPGRRGLEFAAVRDLRPCEVRVSRRNGSRFLGVD